MRRWIVTAGARPEFWLCLLLAWVMLSAAQSLGTPWARVALTEALRWGAGIGLALALSYGLNRTKTAVRALTVTLGMVAVAAIWGGLTPGQGILGPFRDHQLCASCLLVLLPFAPAVALTSRSPAWRWGAQAIGMAALVCLILTETRSAWAGAAAASLVFGVLWLSQKARNSHTQYGRRKWVIPALMAAVTVFLFYIIIGQSEFRNPLAHRAGTLGALAHDTSWQGRLLAWRGAARMIGARPLTGWGVGRYPGLQWSWTGVGLPLSPAQRPSLSEEAHNLYLQTTAELGLIGLGLYFAALAAYVRQSVRFLRAAPARRRGEGNGLGREVLVIATLSLMGGQMVDALASPSWQFAEVSFFFWAALGVGLAAMRRADAPEPVPARLPPIFGRLGRFAATGAVTFTLLAQFLPLGLLTPVEAYTATGATYTGSTITPANTTASVSGTQQVPFTLTVTYTDSAGSHTADVTLDTNSYYGASYNAVAASSTFMGSGNTGSSRNILVLSTGDQNKTLLISGSFYFNGAPKHAYTNLTVTP